MLNHVESVCNRRANVNTKKRKKLDLEYKVLALKCTSNKYKHLDTNQTYSNKIAHQTSKSLVAQSVLEEGILKYRKLILQRV